ncbi:MAG: AAA family ATPase [Achromobacter sp.]|uniref:AAA family ATPase n=1 Tax=Achromobacter sp. TaxID=134375 RepID=UPI003D028E81
MRINRITIENFQGARTVDLELLTPATLIAGTNHSGKSSIAEAVRLALLGSPERVGLKKEYGALVSDGAKLGAVTLELDEGAVGISLPKGAQSGEALVPQSPALPFVLAPERFAAAKPDERRSLLFAMTGTNVKADEIERRLLARGCAAPLVTQIKPILRTGFAGGAEFAKGQATEAKGAWKAAAGEQWGSQKAEGWKAEIPPFDRAALDKARADLATLDSRIDATAQSLGALEQKATAHAATRDQLAAYQAKATQLPALRQKLEFDQAEHAKLAAHVDALQARAGSGPRVGLIHDLAICLDEAYSIDKVNAALPGTLDMRILQVLDRYEAQYGKLDAKGDAEAAGALPKAIEALDLMARSVENDRRDIASAEAAAEQLLGTTEAEAIQPADVEIVRAKVTALRAERKAIDERVQLLLNAKQAATSATERTANAAQYHQEVLAWSAIGDALSPDGIPGEILAEALQPVNDKLADLADLAGWRIPAIGADMIITFAGRPYRLLSESERWRVDALIGAALAEISGLRCMILDRFDCLDLPGRQDALGLVDALASDGRMDTVLVLGTLKTAPDAPTDAFTTFWIDRGSVSPIAVMEAA